MFKYLINLFKKKNPEGKKEDPAILEISHDEIKITPILPIGSPPPELPKAPVEAVKLVVKPKPVISKPPPQALSIKIKPKQYKECPQCMQKINMTDTECRFCLYRG